MTEKKPLKTSHTEIEVKRFRRSSHPTGYQTLVISRISCIGHYKGKAPKGAFGPWVIPIRWFLIRWLCRCLVNSTNLDVDPSLDLIIGGYSSWFQVEDVAALHSEWAICKCNIIAVSYMPRNAFGVPPMYPTHARICYLQVDFHSSPSDCSWCLIQSSASRIVDGWLKEWKSVERL